MLLGIKPKDKDWVVVGATEKEMLSKGFIKIPSKFPVFIHPETKQEYALARSEKKVAKGYHGFEVDYSKYISLEDDLKRRDLTINSIAMDENGKLIDPFNGRLDIQNRILRHTSEAFVEDPLRVIRLARFKTQLSDFGFSIAQETFNLAKRLVKSGELDHLTRERLHIEFIKALKNPNIFFATLNGLEALEIVFPTISCYLSLIPNKTFFEHYLYQKSSDDEKVSLCLLQISQYNLVNLKKELLLTNKQFKLLKASSIIREILECKNITAEKIFELIKNANIIRDKVLFKNSLNVYKKYLKISCKNVYRDYNLLVNILNDINNLNIDNLKITSKNNLPLEINKRYLDIIKNNILT
ncbi:MAG: CCA tRNA nucleotidyltransferase [Francisella sp.]